MAAFLGKISNCDGYFGYFKNTTLYQLKTFVFKTKSCS